MWFRNLSLYRLANKLQISAESLDVALRAQRFKPCAGLAASSHGWEPPLGPDGELLVHAAGGKFMVCMRREERVLPNAVVREELEDRIREIEAAEGRSLRRKERLQLKDEIVVEFLPRAFTRSTRLYAYIDLGDGWVVVDSASPKRAEELLSLLRESLGAFPVKPLQVQKSPALVLTEWLRGRVPAEFELQDECELREPLENGAIVRCRRLALDGDEVSAHLDTGKQAVRLSLAWQDRLSCLLCDDLVVRRLRFLDLVMDEAAATEAEDPVARFDADFALMTLELQRFLPEMVAVFGGLVET